MLLLYYNLTNCKGKGGNIMSGQLTLQELREIKKITQKQIAVQLGISESYYSLIENGKRNLRYEHAKILSKIFNRSLEEIFLLHDFTKSKAKEPA